VQLECLESSAHLERLERPDWQVPLGGLERRVLLGSQVLVAGLERLVFLDSQVRAVQSAPLVRWAALEQ